MKKSLLLAIMCIFMYVCAAGQVWDGSSSQPQLSGTTYTISTPAELAWVAEQSQTQSFAGYSFVMTASLDLGGQNQLYWQPIGSLQMPFEGDFSGGCLTIKNMSLSNISGRQTDYGLFGVIGTNGHIHDLAIESGNFFFDQKNYVGAFAGRNNGTIDHCFSLARIFVDQANFVGGLVGSNAGTIDHCFQGGYIQNANDNVGGIAGYNTGTISNSYVAGFVRGSGSGAVVGSNTGTLENVYFDQQMGPMLASKEGLVAGVTAVPQTTMMYNIFEEDEEWLTSENLYPQIACFATTSPDASLVAACPVLLNDSELPVQRAELDIKDIKFASAQGVTWSSSGEQTSLGDEIVAVSGTNGKVTRPCSTTDVRLTATKGSSSKSMLVSIKGFDPFDPGIIGNNAKACKGDTFKFSDRSKGGEVRDAQGGRDDDKNNYPYYYYFDKYILRDLDGDGELEDTTFVATINVGTSQDYKDFMIQADENGEYMYKRYVRDSQCQTEYVESVGMYFLTVFEYFDAGEIDSQDQVILGNLPQTVTLQSVEDAQGGEGPYYYSWFIRSYDFEGNLLQDSVRLSVSDIMEMQSPTYNYTFDTPGEYYFYRAAVDTYCSNQQYMPSRGAKHITVLEELLPGAIVDSIHTSCTTDVTGLIENETAPTGGTGRYEYRWLCNGVLVEGAAAAEFDLSTFAFESDHTYRFQRQIRDFNGLVDWLTSDNAFVVITYKTIAPGRIAHSENTQCLASDATTIPLSINNVQSATGEGELTYRWVAYRLNSDGSETLVKTMEENTSALHYDMPLSGISFPVTLLVKRQVQSVVCPQDWATADDNAILHLGKDKKQNKDINVCGEELPYTYTYTFADGHTQNVTFNTMSETHVMNDAQADGCALTVTLRCRLWAQPVVDVQPLGSKCEGDEQLTLRYTVRSGNPDKYRITFDEAAQAAGFTAISGDIDNEPIVITIPANAPIGSYQVYAEFYEQAAAGGCAPSKQTLPFNISAQGFIQRKWDDVLFVDNNENNHNPQGLDLKFVTFQWYKNGEPIEGATDQMYYEPYGLDGIYTVVLGGVDGNTYYTCDVEIHPSTGLNDAGGFTMHPVPVLAGQHVSLTTPLTGTAAILDIAGRVVSTLQLNGTQHYTLVAPHQAGTYIVRITDEGGKQTFGKLIVK